MTAQQRLNRAIRKNQSDYRLRTGEPIQTDHKNKARKRVKR